MDTGKPNPKRPSFFARWLSDRKISTKLHLLNAVFVVGLFSICAYSAYTTRVSLYSERGEALQRVMDVARNTIEYYASVAAKGEMPLADAQQRALAVVRDMRHGEHDYFWVSEPVDATHMRRLMNAADDKLVGTVTDSATNQQFIRMVREHGGGTLQQNWPKPGSEVPVPKLTQVVGVPAWNWVLGSGVYLDDIQAAFWSQINHLLAIFLLVWACVTFICWQITRSVTLPLAQATKVADSIAQGSLDTPIPQGGRDEIGRLLGSMRTMQEELRSVLAGLRDMATQHEAGTISFRMDETRFPGDFGKMVSETNALVGSHVDTKLEMARVMSRYAVGDLSEDMPRYSGEKAILTETMDTVKANLQSINGEIKRLTDAMAVGDLSLRGDVDRYQYDFRIMVEGLNTMMDVADRNLGQLTQLLQAIATGKLTQRMHGDFQGVFAQMRDHANATADQLTAIVGRIQQASTAINSAAGEIAAGNNDLSRRTEQQAANLEETAASMEELTSTVRQNAESARQANQLAQGAAGVASKGGEVVGQVVTTMSAIETSSRKIAEIISVIDGIAFQTNILALNAAVEAARAGEQGRGFAVVASEVRTLAQRSANAAREIKELIDDSVGKVADGSALVHQAGTTMDEIVASVQRVTDIMAEISAASQEQSAGIEQVNQTVIQMDETTQQNAALVEEATAAAHAMEEQARGLAEAVSVFRLQAEPGTGSNPPRRSLTVVV